jgi:hypothetical protein
MYRLPQIPVSEHDPFMRAVLWTGAPEACPSHETALACYEISDVNPDKTHVTAGARHRIRRSGGDGSEIHYQDLAPWRIGWWNQVAAPPSPTELPSSLSPTGGHQAIVRPLGSMPRSPFFSTARTAFPRTPHFAQQVTTSLVVLDPPRGSRN